MKTLPSKELLSEVLGFKVEKIDIFDNCIQWFTIGAHDGLNIFECAFKCKKWALSKG